MADPRVASAVALSQTQVRVVFDEAMQNDAALANPVNYTLTPAGGSVARTASLASPQPGGFPTFVDVFLDGEMTDGVANYTVEVNNVADVGGNPIDVVFNDAIYDGIGIQPRAGNARGVAPAFTEVELSYNEAVKQVNAGNGDDALNPANYAIVGTSVVTVNSVNAGPTANTVELVITGMVDLGVYTLTISNVEDIANNVIDPAANSITFTASVVLPSNVLPAVNAETGIQLVFVGDGFINGTPISSPFTINEEGFFEFEVVRFSLNERDVIPIVVLDPTTIQVQLDAVRTTDDTRALSRLKELLGDGRIYDVGTKTFGVNQLAGTARVVVNGPVNVAVQIRRLNGNYETLTSVLVKSAGGGFRAGFAIPSGKQQFRAVIELEAGPITSG